jgi:gliding motility-associated protein GldM
MKLGGSVGGHVVSGKIAVKEKGVKKWKDWTFNYSVGAPNAAVAAADLNVLYRSWDNKLKVSASGYDPSTVSVSCSGCSISKKGDFYIAKVSGKGKTATVNVTAKDDKGNSVALAKEEFRVFSLPGPQIYFANQSIDKPLLSRGLAKSASKLIAKLGNSPLNVPYTVSSFEMVLVKGGKVITVKSKSNKLTGEMKAAIKKMAGGSQLTFTNVKAKGPSGKSQPIGGISFKLK